MLSLCAAALTVASQAQVETTLPAWETQAETAQRESGQITGVPTRGIETPPEYDALRNMAEWEEIQALSIAWISYPGILKQIVAAAQSECEVIILTENASNTETYLLGASGPGNIIDNLDNITVIEVDEVDSVWMRDYAGNPVYGSEVDDLIMVDWIYNRPTRPNDDASPQVIADHLGLDLYCITEAPTDLVNTGGNWMTDGFGTAFASELILDENDSGNEYGVTVKTEEEIDQIVQDWLGVDTYIKMDNLPFDLIHHIDMHMKLLNEETLLVGDFGDESDGPQIQANMEYVLNNFTNKWGEPYEIVWVPMCPSEAGDFPSGGWNSAAYRTYTNSVFVNNTVILPTYRTEFDTTAVRIYEENLPGYNVVSIDCDDDPEPIIFASGAIHCITHSVGVEDPLLISHNILEDTYDTTNDYFVDAYVKHREGIDNVKLYWKTGIDDPYQELTMTAADNDTWEAYIPAQAAGTKVYYYIRGEANDGKVQTRPMVAPEGYHFFRVLDESVGVYEDQVAVFEAIYPNPATAITVVPLNFVQEQTGSITIIDQLGREVMNVYTGNFLLGAKKFFFDASLLESGTYNVVLSTDRSRLVQKLVVE